VLDYARLKKAVHDGAVDLADPAHVRELTDYLIDEWAADYRRIAFSSPKRLSPWSRREIRLPDATAFRQRHRDARLPIRPCRRKLRYIPSRLILLA
jgi:hypothetical protein